MEYPKNDLFRFAYIGRIMKEKGISELFAACKELRQEGFSFLLDLIGFYEDDYKQQLEELPDASWMLLGRDSVPERNAQPSRDA